MTRPGREDPKARRADNTRGRRPESERSVTGRAFRFEPEPFNSGGSVSRRGRDTRNHRYSPIPRRPSPSGRTTYPEFGGTRAPEQIWRHHPNFHDIVHTAGCTVCKGYLSHRLEGSDDATATTAEAERSAYYSRNGSAREGELSRKLDELWTDYHQQQSRADHFEQELNRAVNEIRRLEDSTGTRTGSAVSTPRPQVLGSPLSLLDRFTDPLQGAVPLSLSERIHGLQPGGSTIAGDRLRERLDEAVAPELAGDLKGFQGRYLYNGVNIYQMGDDWGARAARNASVGLPPPLGTIPFTLGRGPIASDPQDETAVRSLMDAIKQGRDKRDKALGAEFISRIEDLGLQDQDLPPHLRLAKELWTEMPRGVQTYKTANMRKMVTKPKTTKIPAPNLGSTIVHWREFISVNPQNRPTGIRATARGVAHIFDLLVHMQIARISAEIYIPNNSTSEERRNLKRAQGVRSAAFFRAVVYIIASRSYTGHLNELQLRARPVLREARFEGYENDNEEVELDDVVTHLADCGISIEWMENPTTLDFALSYLRDWERRNEGKYATARLRGLFELLYPEGRPVVPLVTNPGTGDLPLDTEVIDSVDESIFGDLNLPLPSGMPSWYTNTTVDITELPHLPGDIEDDPMPVDESAEDLIDNTDQELQPFQTEELEYSGDPALDTDDRELTPTPVPIYGGDTVSLYEEDRA
jgi:hypothetical protein